MMLLKLSQTSFLSFFLFSAVFSHTVNAMYNDTDDNHSKQPTVSRVTAAHDPAIEQLVDTVANTPIQNFSKLMETFSSDKERTIQRLRRAYSTFQPNNYPEEPQGDLKTKATQFENFVKALNLRFSLGDGTAKVEYEEMYRHVQRIICEEHAGQNREHYVFHLLNFSLLSPKSRRAIAESYRKGKSPFEVSPIQAEIYAFNLDLPLTPAVF